MNKPTSKLIALFFSACVISGTGLLSSCSKDDDDASVRPEVEIPTEFSEFTAEQNKEKLEDNGIAMVNKMTSLKNASGIQTTISMNHFLGISTPEGGRVATNNKAVKMMLLLSRFGIGKAKASDVLKGFRTKEDEPSTAQEVFDEYKGTYAWNKTTQDWTYTAGGDKIVFQFPSTETGTTNNAELAIYGYTSKQVVNELVGDEGYEGDVPTALKADLSVGGTKQIVYDFTASYKNNGEPTSVKTSLTIGTYKFAFEATNTTTEVGVVYSLTDNGTNILSFGVGATGNFNSDNISESEGAAGDIVTSSSAFFQVMNIRAAGEVKAKTLFEALEVAETAAQKTTAYNANVTLVVFYADTKKKIADTKFIASIYQEEPYEYCYDLDGDGIDETCETYEYEPEETVDLELVFADGSPVDISTYTDEGFSDLTEELEKFQDDLDEDIGG
jgi:hypothetical protein